MLLFQAATLELTRGAPIGTPGYWAVEDTYLDKAEAGQDHGGGYTLLGGDGRTVLLRFGDLSRAVGRGMRVVSASLVLTPSGGDVPKLDGVTAVDAPWGEGPMTTLTRILANVEAGPSKAKTGAAKGAATWSERRAGIAPWPAPGKPGGTTVATTSTPQGREFRIDGLGPTVQGWLDKPWTNDGLALAFEGDVEFFGSQSPSGRPRLLLRIEPMIATLETKPDLAVTRIAKEDGKWAATVRNVGSAPAPATKGEWATEGKAGTPIAVPALAPGAEARLPYEGGEPKEDLQVPNLGFAVDHVAKDPNPANDRLDVFTTGKAVRLKVAPGVDPQAVVHYWNETVAPQSRFSFAPSGVKDRIRLESSGEASDGAADLLAGLRQIGLQLGLPDPDGGGDLYPGLMGYGDTRFEGSLPGRLALPYEPYPNPATDNALLEPTGLLSATDVGRLNDGSDRLPLPKVVLLSAVDLVGRPLPGLELTVEGGGLGKQKLTTGATGSVLLPPPSFKNDLSNGTITVRAGRFGVAAKDEVKAWRLSDSVRRGNTVVVAEVRLNLPTQPLEKETNLAEGKPLVDSAGKPYAYGSPLPAKAGEWVEIDLGRDRTIGEIGLQPGKTFPERVEIRVYGTGGKPEEATLWASDRATDWTLRNRGEDGRLVYRGPAQRIRYIRILSASGGAGSLAGVEVTPVAIAPGS